ncbi:MAG: O-antigen ligase family protein [Cyclobacteriaceae bacterium]|jgi:putative inorganic carbon (HCO3(-)) transporter|nr:O-antigen ligase family protein [Cyclobacteriaceae bacterium]
MVSFTPTAGTQLARFIKGEGNIPSWMLWLVCFSAVPTVTYMVLQFGFWAGIGLIVVIIAMPISIAALWNTGIGLYILVLFAFFISIPNRLAEGIPMGIGMDVMILVMLVGLLYSCTVKRNWESFKTPISLAVFLWAGMNVIELFNPWAGSRAAWFYVIRPAVGYMMLFFLTYSYLDSKQKLFRLLGVILFLSFVSAVWGIWQATVGYFSWEYNYVFSHDLVHLVFNYGRWRAIGSIGSPAQFGILMAFISMLCLPLVGVSKSYWMKFVLLTVSATTLLAMVYSGTRSAFIIIPIFYVIWVFLARQRWMYNSLAVAVVGFIVLATTPSNNYHVQRIQSVFKASEDKSYQTRAKNRAMIFPWILAHPIGGGLGSTGVWGQRFTPGTFLALFAPDSGLIRVAVELGWIGLFFFLWLYFKIIKEGVVASTRMEDKTLQALAYGLLAAITPLLLVEWGQEVIGVFPMSVLFWMFVAILFRAINLSSIKNNANTI